MKKEYNAPKAELIIFESNDFVMSTEDSRVDPFDGLDEASRSFFGKNDLDDISDKF